MKKIVWLIWICAFSTSALAATDAKDLLKKVQKNYDEHKSLVIDFTQKFHWNMTDEEIGMSGKIFIQSGEKFRIETPENLIINDGKALSTVNYNNKQVIVNDASQDGGDHPFLKDFIGKYIREYDPGLVGEKDKVAHLELKAKSEDEFIHTIDLYINTRSNFIEKVVQHDANDNVTTYAVDAINTEKELTSSDFKIPDIDQYEIIDMR